MKLKILITIGLLCLSTALTAGSKIETQRTSQPLDINKTLLPAPFPVFTNGSTVINHPVPGFQKKNLPTNNDYTGHPGCYVACYSHKAKQAVYRVSRDIYVMGQVRVPGRYEGRTCIPKQFKRKDIGGEERFKRLCKKKIQSCGKGCWAGGDTGGWFGIQP